ncbi:MAG: plasmid stability protein [Caldilineaceae bacterium SB0675_bin_29]|uniref:Plasmid stability protein n=1 Tax=Caldilineaceae bacterium SB0675_bin_29 TaxID=2605266 RepID=A0A6B1G8B4_9CHLR|nr:plasmid stability protein [Caldilineaceae bacterium SB0675_bin_29]
MRAAENGLAMEEEGRNILRTELNHQSPAQEDLVRVIHARCAPLVGVELDVPPRSPMCKPPRLV